ncbi:alpha-glucosidase [Lactiplantibacillus plantarum]|uniref:alpha-glucosidase n=1 Tax=Lactiplantibacillus plantarum TaxID=1590 RepID=UPI001C1F2546|nr:alpha-glucosidase [Lactiplantibacillus plantarum]MBU7472273.1 alpha-glucosidase [Lactiplantibacillus plantarum]
MNKKWWQQAVIYQIYPKSFMDSNGDGIGDLPGIISKLTYLKKLGVDALWLSPVYQSPQVDNGYDIADYRHIDPMFGTDEDMYRLISLAHAQGLKIVMDLVANHTSDQSVWFQESRKSRDNYFSDFYIWRDAKSDGSEPNNWGSNFGGSAWEWEPQRQQYYLHYYAKQQPDLNWENLRVRQYIFDMMRFWKAKGVDGWRMDVITSISKDQRFQDNPNPFKQTYVTGNQDNGPRMHEFIHDINREVLSPFEMMSVGESPSSTSLDARKFVDPDREELDMVFTFEHMHVDRKPHGRNGRWDLQPLDLVALKQILSSWQTNLWQRGWNALYFENHDRARVTSRWGNDQQYRYESATAFATVLHGLQGTPFIYQGEEIGMTNPNFEINDYEDIELLTNYREIVQEQQTMTKAEFLAAAHKISRDNARTPMQWDPTSNAGFSSGHPWFKLNPDYTTVNVQNDQNNERSVFAYYQRLIELRHRSQILVAGTYQLDCPKNTRIFEYERIYQGVKWTIIANLSNDELSISTCFPNKKYHKFILKNYKDRKDLECNLRPWESFIIEQGI